MFAKFSYKQKLKALVITSLVMLFICYKLAFAATFAQYQSYIAHKDNTSWEGNSTLYLNTMETKKKSIGLVFNNYKLDTIDNAKNLLSVASSYCDINKLALKEYKPLPEKMFDSIPILTRVITVEGSFIECLKLHYQIELQNNFGRIGSVLYRSSIDPKNKSTNLTCSIYMLNIIDNEKEK